MSVIIDELTPGVIGQRLGQNLYNANGNLLLRRGIEITPRFYEYFAEHGYQSIYLLHGDGNNHTSDINIISERLVVTSPYKLRKIFSRLQNEDVREYLSAKNGLFQLAEELINNINYHINRVYQVLDLKRREDYIYQHCVNVAIYSLMVGQKLQLNDKKLFGLVLSALLHDFGMLFIEPEIVNKAAQLDAAEFEIVKEHTIKGFTHLVRNCSFDGLSTIASVQHHERFDGKGYPNSLDGEKIHQFARIIAVADSFDAWTSDRPHRRMNSIPDALTFLKEQDGVIFDPQVVKNFIEIF